MLHNSYFIVSGLSDFVKRKAGQPCCPARVNLEKDLQANPNRDIIDMKNKNAAGFQVRQHLETYAGDDAPTQRPKGRTA